MTASKVAIIGDGNEDEYVLPGVNHRGGCGQAAGSKGSRVHVSDNREFCKASYWCADSIVHYISGEGTFEVDPVGIVPVGDDQIFFGRSFRHLVLGILESENSWYAAYSEGPGKQGTYAGKYGRAISFLVRLHETTQDEDYLNQARALADEAVAKLNHKGLFRGHPAKPYYEGMDGVGYLIAGLLDLDEVTP